MTLKLARVRSIRLLLAAALVPALAWGQQATASATLTRVIGSGEGVARSCLQSGYPTGLGVLLAIPVLTKRTTVQVAGRGYWLAQGSTCADGFPAPDGVYVEEDRVNLLSRSFVTTDVRLATRLGEAPVSLGVGGGNAWHEGHDLPYLVFAAALSVVTRPTLRLGLTAEFQWLRVSGDRYRRTYRDSELVAEEPLGRVRTGSHAVVIGLNLGIAL